MRLNVFQKGRGVGSNQVGRYEQWSRINIDDDWRQEIQKTCRTSVEKDSSRSAIAFNQSPDLPFNRSINMYRGCEHGCSYCYARPTHTYLGYSAGLDFETRLLFKPDVAEQLQKEITADSYQCELIALGTNTDPYQPIERQFKLTRQILDVLFEHRHPVTITTKSASILHDLALLEKLAKINLVSVNFSITTLDVKLSRVLEPRASAPHSRLRAIKKLTQIGVPITIFYAPVIPGLNEHELELILEKSAQAGARRAEWTMIRLPLEVSELFQEWLDYHYPDRAKKVMNLIRQVRGGKKNSSQFFERMRGSGLISDLIQKRFECALKKFGLDNAPVDLDVQQFRKAPNNIFQPSLF